MWPVWMGFSLPASLAFQSAWLAFNCTLWSSSMRWFCMGERRIPVTPVTIERRGNVIFLPSSAQTIVRGEAKKGGRNRAQVIDMPMDRSG